MLEIGFAIVLIGVVVAVYCTYLSQDSRKVRELIQRIEEEHEDKNE
jgi:hypothetical protein